MMKQVVTKLIEGKTYFPVYESKEVECEPYYNDYAQITTRYIAIPQWDKMQDYTKEAIEYFKTQIDKDGGIYRSTSYYETAETRLNDYLEEIKLEKKHLISINYIPSNEQSGEYFVLVYEK